MANLDSNELRAKPTTSQKGLAATMVIMQELKEG
jgi:hypothetical protein